MPFDRTEHEPEEYDPEAEFRDPDSDSLTIPEISTEESQSATGPEVEIPDVSTEADQFDVPSELLTYFWGLVLVLNGAILAIALAVLFAVFEGSTTRSSWLLVAGLILSAFAYRRYRAYEQLDFDSDDDSTDQTATDDGSTANTDDPTATDDSPPTDDPDDTPPDRDAET